VLVNLKVLEEDAETDCLVLLVPLESQVLLKHVNVLHITSDLAVLQNLEKLLIANLPCASRE